MNQSEAHGAAWLAINRERPKEHKVIGSVNFMNQSEAQTKIKDTEKPQLIGMAVGLERLQLKNDLNHFRLQCADEGITLLESCPFCSDYDVELQNEMFMQSTWYYVDCKSCQVEGPACKDSDAAIAAWNTRVN